MLPVFAILLTLCSSINAVNPNLDEIIPKQTRISQAGILANIGPDGVKSHGAKAGVVIASPSTDDPNYLFTWVRDGSLVYKYLIDEYIAGRDDSLQGTIEAWIRSQWTLQHVESRSGNITTGGLGEPRFNIDETRNDDDWGRPQYDGPGLRVVAVTTYANELLKRGQSLSFVREIYDSVKIDLDFISDNWNKVSTDLWEETRANSFFTTAAQHRALRQGAQLATAMSDAPSHDRWVATADNSLSLLQAYWSNDNYLVANLNINKNRTGMDANTLLGTIHSFDPEAGCDARTFQPCSDRALANHYAVVNSFRSIYPINQGIPEGRGVAVGRYVTDVYYGGNPWYLATDAAAEQLYDALYVWNKSGIIEITTTSLRFFRQFAPDVEVGAYNSTATMYRNIVAGVQQMADDFLLMNDKYTPEDGALAEQYDRATGVPKSAVDLTWSYAASLTAFNRRAGMVPSTWDAKAIPDSVRTYTPPLVTVVFAVDASNASSGPIGVLGNVGGLADFNVNYTIPLQQRPDSTIWSGSVDLPADTDVEYKYVTMGSEITLEAGPNRIFKSPASGIYVLNDNATGRGGFGEITRPTLS